MVVSGRIWTYAEADEFFQKPWDRIVPNDSVRGRAAIRIAEQFHELVCQEFQVQSPANIPVAKLEHKMSDAAQELFDQFADMVAGYKS